MKVKSSSQAPGDVAQHVARITNVGIDDVSVDVSVLVVSRSETKSDLKLLRRLLRTCTDMPGSVRK